MNKYNFSQIYKPRVHETFLSSSKDYVHYVKELDEKFNSCRVQRRSIHGRSPFMDFGYISNSFLGQLKSLGVVSTKTFYI